MQCFYALVPVVLSGQSWWDLQHVSEDITVLHTGIRALSGDIAKCVFFWKILWQEEC